eukprot:m.249735 g.249735  ORF g.249735 m.249735 type:complete len:124 (-) comp26688_c1_seq2:257-628(-)
MRICDHPDLKMGVSFGKVAHLFEPASDIVSTTSYEGGVSCVSFSPVGKVHDFGTPGDRLDTIDTIRSELVSALSDTCGRIQVVHAINYCGSVGLNILGCAFVSGFGLAVATWQCRERNQALGE